MHFFLKDGTNLEWRHRIAETIPWEIYRGRVLDVSQTRLQQEFEAWNLYWTEDGNRSAEPMLSIKLDRARRLLHVVRAVHCYAWEGYDAGNNVFLSRETRKWICELIGTIPIDSFTHPGYLHDEIICLLFHAVVGTSRLPLTSVEAPLPSFSLGRLAYFHRCESNTPEPSCSMQSASQLIDEGLHRSLNWLEKAKLLETLLRSISFEELSAASDAFFCRWLEIGHSQAELMSLCRTLFNEVALSPYTGFVDTFLAFLEALAANECIRPDQHVDFLSYLLRQNARHLTAYDLHTFHHQGANYPDALLLDAALNAYLKLIEKYPQLFMNSSGGHTKEQKDRRMRRRALRQAGLLRREYGDLPVPDQPTSPGENLRVLPAPYERLPEEQIYLPTKRTRRLFAEPLPAYAPKTAPDLFRQCFVDLEHPDELQELGMAVFLDRPLGAFKAVGEPDQSMLLSYEMFSRSIAQRRLEHLNHDSVFPGIRYSEGEAERVRYLLSRLHVAGLALRFKPSTGRPGIVSLDDAQKVADDWVILHTTRRAVTDFIRQFDFTPLARKLSLDYLDGTQRALIVRADHVEQGSEESLLVYDANLRKRLELEMDLSCGYGKRAGQEYPLAGLRAVRAWEPAGEHGELSEHALARIPISVRD